MLVTRFAPSPTGYIHLGNVRSAIYPYLLARQQKGKFILRIEDTDQARLVEGSTELILETLKWLGLDWDEGIIVGGPHAPYLQSERQKLYLNYAQKLLASGRAYADDTPAATIETFRQQNHAQKIPYLYRNHRPANPPTWRAGLPIRFKANPKPRAWHDEVMGDLHAGPEVQDDIILIKADGLPTYNFAHIVDDFEMKVTHVVRGVEYLSSMPNYLALYEALNITPPVFISLPHVLAPTGTKKLSKRDGAKSVIDYKDLGVLPEAILNYLACLGWNDGSQQEIYTKNELIERFRANQIQTSGARFDETKLLWQNGQWIRKIAAEQGIDALYERTISRDKAAVAAHAINPTRDSLIDFWPTSAQTFPETYKKQVLAIIYDRLKILSDLKAATEYFFQDPAIDLSLITANKTLKKFSEQELAELLKLSRNQLSLLSAAAWRADQLQTSLNQLLDAANQPPAVLFSLIRLAVSFAPFSPALPFTLETLGRDTTIARLNATITALANA